MRLQESRRVPPFNGAIERRLFRFDLAAGEAPRVVAAHHATGLVWRNMLSASYFAFSPAKRPRVALP